MLKIYRSGCRGTAEVGAETEAVMQLHDRGASVAVPVPDVEGRLHGQVARPEGPRPYTLTRAIEGVMPGVNADTAPVFGAAAARLHNAGDSVGQISSLRTLDSEFVLDESMRLLRPATWSSSSFVRSWARRDLNSVSRGISG